MSKNRERMIMDMHFSFHTLYVCTRLTTAHFSVSWSLMAFLYTCLSVQPFIKIHYEILGISVGTLFNKKKLCFYVYYFCRERCILHNFFTYLVIRLMPFDIGPRSGFYSTYKTCVGYLMRKMLWTHHYSLFCYFFFFWRILHCCWYQLT